MYIVPFFSKTVKEFIELRGVRWAQTSTDELAGLWTLSNLNLVGESASFFGNVLRSKSHLDSIRMILHRKAHAAAVDSNALSMFLRENPDEKDELIRLTTWGPSPPYSILVASRLDVEIKKAIKSVLLDMHSDDDGLRLLQEFKIKRFESISSMGLDAVHDLIESTKKLSFKQAYY